METPTRKQAISEKYREDLIRWQSKFYNARLLMNSRTENSMEKNQPNVKRLEFELFRAKEKWQKLYTVSDREWKDILTELKANFKTIEKVYAQTERHFMKQKISEL